MSTVEVKAKADKSAHQSLYLPRMARLRDVRKMTEKETYFDVVFEDGSELGHMPGQFVEVSLFGIGEAPISVSSSPTHKGSFELVVRATGNVTNAMQLLKKGDMLGIRGPFGRPFPVNEIKGKDVLFIAGGLGVVPLRSLINYVFDKRADYNKVTIFYGCKNTDERLYTAEVDSWAKRKDVEFHFTVDRATPGWTGNVGVITTLFKKTTFDPLSTVAVVVGPPIMYKFVVWELLQRNLAEDRIILSLERRMKCGVGKCGHCQIGCNYVCQDGPTFKYSEVKYVKEAL